MTSPEHPVSVTDLQALVDTQLGPSAWHPVTQTVVNTFADVTRDHQWIHVDSERAAAGVFGTTIAHGLYTLSLGPALLAELISFDGFAQILNYGYEKVRFPAPLPVGADVRMRATIRSVTMLKGGAAHVLIDQAFERSGHDKPVCVATQASRFIERLSSE
ncbi:MaoC family dehydratase [Nocardia nova]|uniref:MaoC family dehydratase n=1 Tax=Nocardia nova TaxID=37330 RepID=UPI0037A3007B